MNLMVLDAGNSIIKAKIVRRKNGELAFPHALKPITEADYTSIQVRAPQNPPSSDYLKINGKPLCGRCECRTPWGTHPACRFCSLYPGLLRNFCRCSLSSFIPAWGRGSDFWKPSTWGCPFQRRLNESSNRELVY